MKTTRTEVLLTNLSVAPWLSIDERAALRAALNLIKVVKPMRAGVTDEQCRRFDKALPAALDRLDAVEVEVMRMAATTDTVQGWS